MRSRSPSITPLSHVYAADQRCLGFILSRGREGYSAFNADARPIGMFKTQAEAANAIYAASEKGKGAG
jgi:hypothetical protein